MPKQHYRYSYDTIDIFQKLSDCYASSNTNICCCCCCKYQPKLRGCSQIMSAAEGGGLTKGVLANAEITDKCLKI